MSKCHTTDDEVNRTQAQLRIRLLMLLTLVGGTSLLWFWMPGGLWSTLGFTVMQSFWSFTGSWLLCPELLPTMMVVLEMLLIFWFGIGVVSKRRRAEVRVNVDCASPPGRLVSSMALGCR